MAEKNLGKVRMTDSELEEKINEIIGEVGTGGGYTVLWENPAPSAAFGAQTITLEESLGNYKYYELIYHGAAVNYFCSTGKLIIGKDYKTMLISFNFGSGINTRTVTIEDDKVTFANCLRYAAPNNSSNTTQNSINIPVRILGYK